jgi:hypothetical protein
MSVIRRVLMGFLFVFTAPVLADDNHTTNEYSSLIADRELSSKLAISNFELSLKYCDDARTVHQPSKATTWEDFAIDYGRKLNDADGLFNTLSAILEDKHRRAALALEKVCTASTAAACINIIGDQRDFLPLNTLLSSTSRLRQRERLAFKKFLDCINTLDAYQLQRGDKKAIIDQLDDGIRSFKHDFDTLSPLVRFQSADY